MSIFPDADITDAFGAPIRIPRAEEKVIGSRSTAAASAKDVTAQKASPAAAGLGKTGQRRCSSDQAAFASPRSQGPGSARLINAKTFLKS